MSEYKLSTPNTDLFGGPHQYKRKVKPDLPLSFLKLMFVTHHCVSRILSGRSGDYLIDTFSRETWLAVSMNKTGCTPKGTKCRVVFVLKDNLAIFPRPAMRSS